MDNDSRPDTRLTLTVDWPEITLENLSRLASLWANLVQSVSAEAAGKRQAVRWIIREVQYGSPLVLQSEPEATDRKIDRAVIDAISHAVVAGMEQLENHPDQPDYFSTQSLGIAKKLAMLVDAQQHRRISVSNGHDGPVQLSPRIAATVNDIFGPVEESYGTVEGLLEGVFTHNKRRFYVYESLTGKQVRCIFDYNIVPLKEVLSGYEKRVSVSGLIRSKATTGEHLSIQVAEFSVLEDDESLPSTDEILSMWGRK